MGPKEDAHAVTEEQLRSNKDIRQLIHDGEERLKELTCINLTNQIIKEQKSVDETLQQICHILPAAWQFPEYTVARIFFAGKEFITPSFVRTEWRQEQGFETIDGKSGTIEICYTRQFNTFDEGPFLKEERQLLDNLAINIVNWLNSIEARKILDQSRQVPPVKPEISEFQAPVLTSRQLLQKFLNKQNANRDILFDLMPFKVKDILLVSTLYDAFSIEKEGRFSEHILGEYHQLNLTSMPRVTGVSNYEEAMLLLKSKHYDLLILMVGSDKKTPLEISRKVKQEFPYIPIYILLNNKLEVPLFKSLNPYKAGIDRIFVWNGDSKVFFAMVKHLEDKVNVENDTQIGLVKVILLVEDSEVYYSRYLPMLYQSVMEQTKRIIEDVSTDEMFKVLRLRARPKILLATNFEEAVRIFENYSESLLCMITDVIFERDGKNDMGAGFALVEKVREQINELPIIIQSSDVENARQAYELKTIFVNKNSESLLQDVKGFISHYLGFGSFVYRDASGRKIGEANSLREFEKLIDTIPAESLTYHGKRNHFSLWLMARGEIKIARMIHPVKVSDFNSSDEFRNYLKFAIRKYRNESHAGKVIGFEEQALLDESNIVSLGSGSLGGKGRGLAFINTLIYNLNFNEILPGINVRTPRTSIIGTDEFDLFLERNNLHEAVFSGIDHVTLQELFLNGELSHGLDKRLKALLKVMKGPIAIRSSSLFEDSTFQPFSGIFDTFLLPNNHEDFDVRFRQLTHAIKLVYASTYSDKARTYFRAIDYKIEEEKMAIVIQEVAGNKYGDYFYPHISGTAQSHNYYPVANMQPEDGFAVVALGLGHYVVSGEKAYRFSPRYPDVEFLPPRTLLTNSQTEFVALDMTRADLDMLNEGEEASLARLPISVAENDGTIKHLVWVFDIQNDRMEPGLSAIGPRILNFSSILKYGYTPLPKAIDLMLDVMQEALGCPVEIEFAVDLENSEKQNPSFYVLQMKPLHGSGEDFILDASQMESGSMLLRSEKSMGNGKIDDIRDVIYIDRNRFDRTQTIEMVKEIEAINSRLMKEGTRYILIGPGRWGTRDRFLGIPVNWTQICNARVIVEMSLEGFPLDASLGSHFFHNVTSMNVGYFSVQHTSKVDLINWDLLEKQETVSNGVFVKHVRFNTPLQVLMDGKKRVSIIHLV
ncbi:MAG: PEP/pyruvate-binding domain-containing protein [Bacteroidales bacterium]